jgi:hypothetical protein
MDKEFLEDFDALFDPPTVEMELIGFDEEGRPLLREPLTTIEGVLL